MSKISILSVEKSWRGRQTRTIFRLTLTVTENIFVWRQHALFVIRAFSRNILYRFSGEQI